MERHICTDDCTVNNPCEDCPCIPFDPIVGHVCDLDVDNRLMRTAYIFCYLLIKHYLTIMSGHR